MSGYRIFEQDSQVPFGAPTRTAAGAATPPSDTVAQSDFTVYVDNGATGETLTAGTIVSIVQSGGVNRFYIDLSVTAALAGSTGAGKHIEVWFTPASITIDGKPVKELWLEGRIETDAEKYSRIFQAGLVHGTKIATLTSQTQFTLTEGSPDDDAYNGMPVVIRDATTLEQRATGIVQDYTGTGKAVVLEQDPGVFTVAVGDYVGITLLPAGLTAQQKLDVNTEADTALSDYDPPTAAELASGLGALNDLDAAGVQAAVGLASANLDTQLAKLTAVPTKGAAFTFTFTMVGTDGIARKPGLTVTAQVSKEGGSFAAAGGTVTEIASGVYKFAASSADMTANFGTFRFSATGSTPAEIHFVTDGGV